jgi:ABC-type transporter MlaC component
MTRIRLTAAAALAALALVADVSMSRTAHADAASPEDFVRTEQTTLQGLLRQPVSADRDAKLNHELDGMVDYDELARRTFGHPCQISIPSCTDHWKDLTDAQKTEVAGLLKRLVQKNYRRNLVKTLGYDVTYNRQSNVGVDAKVATDAQKHDSRDPPISIDYLVHGAPGAFRVVDIITERSSMAKNYYEQFHRMLTDPNQGYAHVVQRLNDRINKKD